MKLWNRLVTATLALLLAFSLGAAQSQAATSKKTEKKKKEEKKEEKKREERRHESYSGSMMPIAGLNIAGKPGYFFADTASVLHQGQVAGGAHLTFDTWGNQFQIPFGVSFGITDKITANVNTAFYSAGGASGLNYLGFGGKYGFKDVGHNRNLDIAAGLDFAVGPLYNSIYGTDFAFDPYGVVTYTFPDGFQLNGKLGLYIETYNYTFLTTKVSGSWSYFQLDLGAAYPFDKDLTGIAELATNGVVVAGGTGGTPLLVGIRTGHDVQLQAFGGLDLGGAVGLFLGGGLTLFSE